MYLHKWFSCKEYCHIAALTSVMYSICLYEIFRFYELHFLILYSNNKL